MKIEYIETDKLKPFEKNPKSHPKEQIDRIVRSIQEFGFTNPILALKENNMIIAGHARLKAAQQMNLAQVPVIFLDMPYEKAIAYVVADNRLAELATWDEQMLLPLLEDIKMSGIDIELTGFTLQDISLMNKKDIQEDDFDAGAAADAIKEPITQVGDIWILGRHRLLCGDSTKREDVERLMDGKKADMVFTDPPYGNLKITDKKGRVGKSNAAKCKEYHIYKNEGNFDFKPAWDIIQTLSKKIVVWGGNYFADFLPITTSWLVWDKRAGEHSWFSDCELAWTNLGCPARVYKYVYQGMIQEGKKEERVHPTQKPVALMGAIINDYIKQKSLILDLFGGSGSTLIACEQLNHTSFLMELDPIYCDVIVQRWEKFTGQKAHKQSDTTTYI